MTRAARCRRYLLRGVALTCATWSLCAPVLGRVIYPDPVHPPQGATKLVFFCHLK